MYQLAVSLVEAAGHKQNNHRKLYLPTELVPYKPHPHFVMLTEGALSDLVNNIKIDTFPICKNHLKNGSGILEYATCVNNRFITVLPLREEKTYSDRFKALIEACCL